MRLPARRRPSCMDAKNLANLYNLSPLDWSPIAARLAAGVSQAPKTGGPGRHTCWLTTINSDGSPHVTGVGALWVDDGWWFETGPRTRKAKNLAADPRCALSVSTEEFDLVVEGTARRITDPATVTRLARTWAEGQWPVRVDDTGIALTADFSAPSAGPPPWHVYQIETRTATAVATVPPGGATRWTM